MVVTIYTAIKAHSECREIEQNNLKKYRMCLQCPSLLYRIVSLPPTLLYAGFYIHSNKSSQDSECREIEQNFNFYVTVNCSLHLKDVNKHTSGRSILVNMDRL